MNKVLTALVGVLIVGGFCWLFPPVRVHSLKAVRDAQLEAGFDAAGFAERFWQEQLLPAAADAYAVTDVLAVWESSPEAVREQFGRTMGVSSSYVLLLRGTGRVLSVDDDQVELVLDPGEEVPRVVIPLGFVFGNAVRDCTGLLDPSDYPNAQEFNDIAAELNAIVETDVLPRLQEIAAVGTWIEFAGSTEITDEELDLNPIELVPILVKRK